MLSRAEISKASCPSDRSFIRLWDDPALRLYLQVEHSSKTWYVSLCKSSGRQQVLRLGAWPEMGLNAARAAAKRFWNEASSSLMALAKSFAPHEAFTVLDEAEPAAVTGDTPWDFSEEVDSPKVIVAKSVVNKEVKKSAESVLPAQGSLLDAGEPVGQSPSEVESAPATTSLVVSSSGVDPKIKDPDAIRTLIRLTNGDCWLVSLREAQLVADGLSRLDDLELAATLMLKTKHRAFITLPYLYDQQAAYPDIDIRAETIRCCDYFAKAPESKRHKRADLVLKNWWQKSAGNAAARKANNANFYRRSNGNYGSRGYGNRGIDGGSYGGNSSRSFNNLAALPSPRQEARSAQPAMKAFPTPNLHDNLNNDGLMYPQQFHASKPKGPALRTDDALSTAPLNLSHMTRKDCPSEFPPDHLEGANLDPDVLDPTGVIRRACGEKLPENFVNFRVWQLRKQQEEVEKNRQGSSTNQ